jgi:hypothetical protein
MRRIGLWEEEYLNKRIEELKKFLDEKKEKDENYFLAKKLIEVYEFLRMISKQPL